MFNVGVDFIIKAYATGRTCLCRIVPHLFRPRPLDLDFSFWLLSLEELISIALWAVNWVYLHTINDI